MGRRLQDRAGLKRGPDVLGSGSLRARGGRPGNAGFGATPGVMNEACTRLFRAIADRRRARASCLHLPILLLFLAGEAWAEEVPESVEPGLQERRFEAPVEPKSTLEPEEPLIEQLPTPPEAERIRFILTEVTVEGSTVYEDSDFVPFYEEYLGQEVSLADLYRIADAITAKYRGDGYILSRAVVPAQTIREGVIRIRVIEGFVDRVIIDGEIRGPESLLRAYGEKITASRPLKASDLERYLLLMDDLPGVGVRSVLAPSPIRTGASDLIITLTHDLAEGLATFDNRGTRFIGPLQASIAGKVNSPFRLYEMTAARFITTRPTRELRYYELAHEQQLGAEGTKLILAGNLSISRPGFTLKEADIRGLNRSLTVRLSHPFIRGRRQNLVADLEFDARNSKSKIGGDVLSQDQLRIVRLGVTYDFADELLGVNLLGAEASQGVNILGARPSGSPDLSRENGRSNFTKVTGNVSRLQRLLPGVAVSAAATGQYAFSQLLVSEEFGLGGRRFGRAFDPFELTGDHGWAVSAEVQFGRPQHDDFFKGIQVYGFYDYGVVLRIDPGTGKERETLSSAGFGARLNLGDRLLVSFELAKPLHPAVASQEPDDGKDLRFFFSLALRF